MDNIEKMGKILYDCLSNDQKMQMYKDMIHNVRDNTISRARLFNNESLSNTENFLKKELDNDYFNPELKQTKDVRLLVLNKNLELYKNKYLDISSKKV